MWKDWPLLPTVPRRLSDLIAVVEDVPVQVDLETELAGAEGEALGDEGARLLGLAVEGRILDLRRGSVGVVCH